MRNLTGQPLELMIDWCNRALQLTTKIAQYYLLTYSTNLLSIIRCVVCVHYPNLLTETVSETLDHNCTLLGLLKPGDRFWE